MYNIREAKMDDMPMIAHLSGILGYSDDQTVVLERFKAINADNRHTIFVAESDSHEIAGWIHVLPRILLLSRPIAEIGGLVVSEKHRRNGVGKMLVEHAEAWTIKQNYEGLIVRSDSKREEAHHFYPNIGFNFIKNQKVYIKFFNE